MYFPLFINNLEKKHCSINSTQLFTFYMPVRHQQWTQQWNTTVSFTGENHGQQPPRDFCNNFIMEVGVQATMKFKWKNATGPRTCNPSTQEAQTGLKRAWTREPVSKRKKKVKSVDNSTLPWSQKPFFRTPSHCITLLAFNFWSFCLSFLSARIISILPYVLPHNWVSLLHFWVCVCMLRCAGMCICDHTHVWAHKWKPEDNLKHRVGTIYFVFETVPFTGLEPAKSAKLASQWAAAWCSFLQYQIQPFNVGPGDPNSGSRASKASNLLTELSP